MSGESALVVEGLKATDRDRYLATLVLPDEKRAAIATLYAFSAEIGSIRDRAKNPAAGEIRLQWWDDALGGQGHGEVRRNPLAAALLDVIKTYGLPTAPLRKAISARRFDLYQDPMPDVPSFEGYAGETVSTLLQLGAMILNGGRPVEAGDAAGHLGVAQALVGHLRAFGYNASQGRIFLPLSVFAAHGLGETEILAGTASSGLTSALDQLGEMARTHIEAARRAAAQVPVALRPVFAPVATLPAQLRTVRSATPFVGQPDVPDWRKIALMTWWLVRKR